MAGRAGRALDIPLDAPLMRHPDVVPAVEDRSYVVFIAGALALAIGGGFALAILVSLAESGVLLETRVPWLIQAHGWAQLEGWAGLFVAGMGFRLLPRFAGRRPLPRRVNFAVFALLLSGVVVRTVAQPAPETASRPPGYSRARSSGVPALQPSRGWCSSRSFAAGPSASRGARSPSPARAGGSRGRRRALRRACTAPVTTRSCPTRSTTP